MILGSMEVVVRVDGAAGIVVFVVFGGMGVCNRRLLPCLCWA